MARGLMPSAGRPRPAALAGGGAPPAGQAGEGMPAQQDQQQAGPSEADLEVYREFLGSAMNLIYDPKTAEHLANILRRSDNSPAEGMAVEPLAMAVTAAVSKTAFESIQAGQPITRDMANAAAATLAADIGRNLAESAGATPLPDDHIQAVYLRSMEMLADQGDPGAGPQEPPGALGPGPQGGGPAPAPAV